MTRTRYLNGIFPLLLALAATSAQAADDYLKLIPSTALAWGAVNHMSDASAKVQKLVVVVGVPMMPNMLDSFKAESGITKGLDEKRAGGFFVLPGKTEKDPVLSVTFIAIEDEKEFLGNFKVEASGEQIKEIKVKAARPNLPPGAVMPPGALPPGGGTGSTSTQYVCVRNGYALITSKKEKAALEAALAAKQDISAEMAGFESWLAENDGSVVGTAAGIKYAAKQAGAELKKAKTDPAAGAPPEAVAMIRSIMDSYGKALEAAPSEISLALAGIRHDKQGSIHVASRARLINGGQVSKAIAEIQPLTEKLFSGIPGGPFIFAAGGVGIPKLADGYMNLLAGLMKGMKSIYGMSDEEIEKMTKDSAGMFGQIRSMNFVMKTGKRGDPIYSNIYSTMRVENSQRMLEFQEKYAGDVNKRMQNAKQGALKSITAKRLEIAGRPALQEEMNFDMSSMIAAAGPGPQAEASRAMMDAMLGVSGKMLFYFVSADEHTALMGMGVSQDRMAAALGIVKQPRKSLAEDADVSVTAAMLPADAQWVAYVSPRGYVQMTQRLMSVAMKSMPGGEEFTMPQFPKTPPIGFAVKAAPAELDAEIVVPGPIVEAAGEYVKEMQKAMMRMMQQQPGQPPPPAP